MLQPVCALLLYFTLLPPRQASTPGTLVVMTAQADRVALPASLDGQPRVALPEAPAGLDAERVPDLGTALPPIHIASMGLPGATRSRTLLIPEVVDGPVREWPGRLLHLSVENSALADVMLQRLLSAGNLRPDEIKVVRLPVLRHEPALVQGQVLGHGWQKCKKQSLGIFP